LFYSIAQETGKNNEESKINEHLSKTNHRKAAIIKSSTREHGGLNKAERRKVYDVKRKSTDLIRSQTAGQGSGGFRRHELLHDQRHSHERAAGLLRTGGP